jgi:hypothetical protein
LLSSALEAEILDFVESSSGDKFICTGNVTSEGTLRAAKALAKKRADAVCAYISSLEPSVLVQSTYSVPNNRVNTSVSRRVDIDAYSSN